MTVIQNPAQLNGHELIAEGSDVPVECETLDIHVGYSEDSRSWALVAPTGLYADEPVLNDIDSSDAVFTPEGIESIENVNGIGVDLVADGELDRKALFKVEGDLIGGVRSRFRGLSQLPHIGRRSSIGVFEDTSLVRDVEHVLVRGPWLGSSLTDRDLFLSGIFEQGLATSESMVKFYTRQWFESKKSDTHHALPGILHGAITLISGFNP